MDEEEEAAAMPDANGDGSGAGGDGLGRQHVEDFGPGVGQVLADARLRQGTEHVMSLVVKRPDHVAPNESQVNDPTIAKLSEKDVEVTEKTEDLLRQRVEDINGKDDEIMLKVDKIQAALNDMRFEDVPTAENSTNSTEKINDQVDVSTSSRNGSRKVDEAKKTYKLLKGKKAAMRSKSSTSLSEDLWYCSYCKVTVKSRVDFDAHCRGQSHQNFKISDEGQKWQFRAPPRGIGADAYKLCRQKETEGVCNLGSQCVDAHSKEELREWQERFRYKLKRAQKAEKLLGKSFVDTILEKLEVSKYPEGVLKQQLGDVQSSCDRPRNVKVTSDSGGFSWTFELKSMNGRVLRDVALLNDSSRDYFSIEQVKMLTSNDEESNIGVVRRVEVLRTINISGEGDFVDDRQEWSNSRVQKIAAGKTFRVKISFRANIFGTFRQTVVFGLGGEPFLRKDLCVDVVPPTDARDDQEEELARAKEKIVQQKERWDESNSFVVDFDPPLLRPDKADETLLKAYPAPQPSTFQLSPAAVEPQLNRANYRARMHALLRIEEMAQFDRLAQFNVVTKLYLTNEYLLTPTSTNSSTAKYARKGELFGKMTLGANLSEDTPAGRLVLTNCSMLLLRKSAEKTHYGKQKVYSSSIEDCGKNELYLRLSEKFVSDLGAVPHTDVEVEVQFHLNRVPICEMHLAVDRLTELNVVYPDVKARPTIPWNPTKQWADDMVSRLNPKQREAILALTAPTSLQLPPLLIIGPFGTGKTFTLAQAIKMLLRQEYPRILVCTHSNSAADLYIREYLDPYVEENPGVKMVRIYYRHRWVQTVHPSVLKYCLINQSETRREFRNPTIQDIWDCRIVIATLSTARCLSDLGLPNGFFSHILLDEAAQAMECEALMPLTMASSMTRIVLAGDHMQLSPEVFSAFATERRFNRSLLERLYDHYPADFPCKILLSENYRSHEAIIAYTSELFYEQKLVASGKQPRHDKWFPLTVFTARGEDVQDTNSTSFYNNAEVYEVVERVAELQRNWPAKLWGRRDENSIGVVTPYYDQVQRIRSELRKRKLFGVSVERVLNVQGKQFRAIFLSTVRTRKTCVPAAAVGAEDDYDFGFLSNAKLLNTAITRSQSLVAVVGDPVALCSIGKCRKMWERFVEISNKNQSLVGLKWIALRTMLDNVELKKTYVLNPFAKEFVPRIRYRDPFLMHYPFAASPVPGPTFLPAAPFFDLQAALYAAAAASTLSTHPYLPLPPWPFLPPPPPAMPPQPPALLRPMPPIVSPYMTVPPFPASLHPPSWLKMSATTPSASTPSSPLPTTIMAPFGVPAFGPRPVLTSTVPHVAALFPQPMPPAPALQHAISSPSLAIPPFRPPQPSPFGHQSQHPAQMTHQQRPHLPPTPTSQPPPFAAIEPPQRLPNPAFANSRYLRPSATPSPTATPTPAQTASESPSFAFLKDGVHFPSCSSSAPQPKSVQPALDAMIELLPQGLALEHLVRSQQMQLAWYNQLLADRGQREADQFKELLATVQQNPDLMPIISRMRGDAGTTTATSAASVIRAHELEASLLRSRHASDSNSFGRHPSNANNGTSSRRGDNLSNVLGLNAILGATSNDMESCLNVLLETDIELPTPTAEKSDNLPLYLRRFSGSQSSSSQSAAAHSERNSAESAVQRPLTYANVLQKKPIGEHVASGGGLMSLADPLAHIRDLGTRGNREADSRPDATTPAYGLWK